MTSVNKGEGIFEMFKDDNLTKLNNIEMKKPHTEMYGFLSIGLVCIGDMVGRRLEICCGHIGFGNAV